MSSDAGTGGTGPRHEKYEKLSQLEHVLLRPEMYIGSTQTAAEDMWTLSRATTGTSRFIYKEVKSNQGLLKLFDEILVNASDNIERSGTKNKMTFIKVHYDTNTHRITVRNDGVGIPIRKHETEKIWIPILIFGELLTGSNFREEDSTAAGRHGYGAKLTNIFSKEFSVKCQHKGIYFEQHWKNNKQLDGEPVVSKGAQGLDFTEISWIADFDRFGTTAGGGYSKDLIGIFRKRCLDLAVANPDVAISWNDVDLPSSFQKYVNAHAPENDEVFQDSIKMRRTLSESSKFGIYWTDEIAYRRDVSCVNAVMTSNGGTHLNYYKGLLAEGIRIAVERHKKEHPNVNISEKKVINGLGMVCFANVIKPKFDSQSKNKLVSDFHTKCSFYDVSALADYIRFSPRFEDYCVSEVSSILKEMNQNASRGTQLRIPKLMDAVMAGKGRTECTLIVTEGDSAKALAASSLTPDMKHSFGVFPVRGKVLNIRQNFAKLKGNQELQHLFQAMGLRPGVTQTVDDLRYQRMLIMTDQDPDGSHIRGLLLNVLDYLFPKFLGQNGFVELFVTPLLKAFVNTGRGGSNTHEIAFFSRKEFEVWESTEAKPKKLSYTVKYYKGLGTSTAKEGRVYMNQINAHTLSLTNVKADGDAYLRNAFSGESVAWRKDWVTSVSMTNDSVTAGLDTIAASENRPGVRQYPLRQFIMNELVHFAVYDCARSLPNVMDGLKLSSRKTLWCMLHRANTEVKVSSLVGHVTLKSNYHHGEASLLGVMVRMAQDFVGSNNIPLLQPLGQFGTRLTNGKDAAAPRYIFTKVPEYVRTLFCADDDGILDYTEEDGHHYEPKHFSPVIPMLFCNGSTGIGTGFMASIPTWHPLDLVKMVEYRLESKAKANKFINNVPVGAVGHLGLCVKKGDAHYSYGKVTIHKSKKKDRSIVRILDLGLYHGIESYKESLDKLYDDKEIDAYSDFSTGISVDFAVTMKTATLKSWIVTRTIYKKLDLEGKHRMTLTVMDSDQKVRIHDDMIQAFEEYFERRLDLYAIRQGRLIAIKNNEMTRTEALIKFTADIKSGKLKLTNVDAAGLDTYLHNNKYPVDPEAGDYDYLTDRKLTSILKDNTEALEKRIIENKENMKILRGSNPEKLWLQDLARFSKAFIAYEQHQKQAIKSEHNLRDPGAVDGQLQSALVYADGAIKGPPPSDDGGGSGGDGGVGGAAGGTVGSSGGPGGPPIPKPRGRGKRGDAALNKLVYGDYKGAVRNWEEKSLMSEFKAPKKLGSERGITPFFAFMKDKRAEVVHAVRNEEMPASVNLTPGAWRLQETTRRLGTMWKALTPEQKHSYGMAPSTTEAPATAAASSDASKPEVRKHKDWEPPQMGGAGAGASSAAAASVMNGGTRNGPVMLASATRIKIAATTLGKVAVRMIPRFLI